jgi:hypothetical protein
MQNHYFDDSGYYTRSAPANPDSAPPRNALRTAPPEAGDNQWPCVVDGAWALAESYKGKTAYDTSTARPLEIENHGPLPEGLTLQEPGSYPAWDAEAETWTTDKDAQSKALAEKVRAERDRRIEAIMWRVQRYESEVRQGWTDTTDDINVLDTELQALRDVPQQEGFPEAVVWPESPALPE